MSTLSSNDLYQEIMQDILAEDITEKQRMGLFKQVKKAAVAPIIEEEEQEVMLPKNNQNQVTPDRKPPPKPLSILKRRDVKKPPPPRSGERLSCGEWLRIKMKKFLVFWPVKVAQVLCVMFILAFTYMAAGPEGLIDPNSWENTENGVILVNGDYRPIVARGTYQMFCLTISRASAFSLYPVMILVFLSKCKATMSFFNKTPLSMYTIQDSHELHAFAGKYIAFDVWIHTLFHLLRWIDQDNIDLLWTHRAGLTGLIVVGSTPIICFPMMYWKRLIRYEIRKGLHYLFYVFAIVLCFHVPPSAIPNGGYIAYVLGFCIGLYTLDTLYVFLFMSEKIETTTFHVLPTGVQMTMNVSKRFQNRGEQGGFAYVCLPWVDKNQWHAFSLFESPIDPSQRQVFMLNTGDWTKAVHAALQRDTVRPVWVQGPFASPYSNAEAYDNEILVASGIGITPALSVIRAHKDSRRLNLIWAVRDPAMLEFFLEHMYLDHDGWNLIYYTGKKPLNPALEELNTNVRVHKGRPDLKTVIPNIIYGIESGIGKPEAYVPSEIAGVKELVIERMRELDEMDLTNREKLLELTAFACQHGYLFSELVNEMEKDLGPSLGDEITVFEDNQSAYDLGAMTDDDDTLTTGTASLSPSTHGRSMLQRIRDFADAETTDSGSEGRSPTRGGSSFGLAKAGRRRSGSSEGELLTQPPVRVPASEFNPNKGDERAKGYVKALDKDSILSTWGILYCGGSRPVEKDLKRIGMEYNITLNLESFAW